MGRYFSLLMTRGDVIRPILGEDQGCQLAATSTVQGHSDEDLCQGSGSITGEGGIYKRWCRRRHDRPQQQLGEKVIGMTRIHFINRCYHHPSSENKDEESEAQTDPNSCLIQALSGHCPHWCEAASSLEAESTV